MINTIPTPPDKCSRCGMAAIVLARTADEAYCVDCGLHLAYDAVLSRWLSKF